MAVIRAFRGYRPVKELAPRIASRPYDVLDSDEARVEVKGNPFSFLHVVKPEVDLPPGTDLHADMVYEKGKANLDKMISDGVFFRDEGAFLYVYAQTMKGRTQYGLVGCASIHDYRDNIIRKHELTRPDKEKDRKEHVRVSGFHAEPVFFAYPDHNEINSIIADVVNGVPEYDFVAEDGIGHRLWVIREQARIQQLESIFASDIPFTYVADGHHRTAAAAGVGAELARANPTHTGEEEYNYFLAVHFPAGQLTIIDYNRVVKDLNGMDGGNFLGRLAGAFDIEKKGKAMHRPEKLHNFGLYLSGTWYSLSAKEGTYDDDDPIGRLDVTVLSKQVLEPLLGIHDLRKSKRIDFVGGIRGLKELERRVDSGEMKAAFAMYPVSMEQLMEIADTNNIMPPKTTWFEPKLRSGLVIHKLAD